MSPEELPALLTAIRDRAAEAAPPVAMAMADTFGEHLRDVTLNRYSHPPFSKTPAPEGQPPARISGDLARSVRAAPLPGSGMVAHAEAGPHTIYARLQQEGGDIFVRRRRYLKWLTDYPTDATAFWKSEREGGGLFLNFAKSVHIPARPYMEPARDEVTGDGSLTRRAMEAFTARTRLW